MTRSQFATAVMASEKWVENAARLLNRKFRYTKEESVWLGLVRELNFEVRLPLSRAAEVADEALGSVREEGHVVVGQSEGSSAAIVIDMPRFRSSMEQRSRQRLPLAARAGAVGHGSSPGARLRYWVMRPATE